MPGILLIDNQDRMRALLQCRLKAETKIRFAPSIEAAWGKLNSRKFDLIFWNIVNDSAAETNLRETLKRLSTNVCGGRIVVFADSEALPAAGLPGGNVSFENLPADDEDLVAFIQSSLPVKAPSDQSNSSPDNSHCRLSLKGL
jgi:DNA-binding NtrC family response regulator